MKKPLLIPCFLLLIFSISCSHKNHDEQTVKTLTLGSGPAGSLLYLMAGKLAMDPSPKDESASFRLSVLPREEPIVLVNGLLAGDYDFILIPADTALHAWQGTLEGIEKPARNLRWISSTGILPLLGFIHINDNNPLLKKNRLIINTGDLRSRERQRSLEWLKAAHRERSQDFREQNLPIADALTLLKRGDLDLVIWIQDPWSPLDQRTIWPNKGTELIPLPQNASERLTGSHLYFSQIEIPTNFNPLVTDRRAVNGAGIPLLLCTTSEHSMDEALFLKQRTGNLFPGTINLPEEGILPVSESIKIKALPSFIFPELPEQACNTP